MFEPLKQKPPLVFIALKRLCVLALSIYLVIGLISAYRAWYQVKSLELGIAGSGSVIRPNDPRAEVIAGVSPGSLVEARLVSYARTTIDVRLELVQGEHAETLFVKTLRGNQWGFFDPRAKQATFGATLTAEVLDRFHAGPATLRATAIGREQWTRLPPPVIRNAEVVVQRKEAN
jgi:hypothetical protein